MVTDEQTETVATLPVRRLFVRHDQADAMFWAVGLGAQDARQEQPSVVVAYRHRVTNRWVELPLWSTAAPTVGGNDNLSAADEGVFT